MMRFLDVLEGAEVLALEQRGNPEISGLQYDSRRVQPGDLFVAFRGEKTDGNRYIEAAVVAGAVAVVSDSADALPTDIAAARVTDGRCALARLSANFYRRPAEKLSITGITGTNGKTTSAFLLESIFTAAARSSYLVGTVEYHIAGKTLRAPHTTPESLELNQFFAQALRAGATEGVMEVSSHALAQGRVYAIPFDVAVFTNLTRDHLDYHGNFDGYFAAKRLLFEGCGTEPPRVAVVNADDEYGVRLARFSKSQGSEVITYGISKGEVRAHIKDMGQNGTRFDLQTPKKEEELALWSPLIGRVNVYNVLAAASAAYARGCPPDAIARGVAALERVPGRFERVDCGQPFTVIVDYAHTDDALRNLTALARDFVSRIHQTGEKSTGRVITVFGCGGDRDHSKRPLMGEATGRGSDFVVLTSDNPRSEDPMAIIGEALPGLKISGAEFTVQPDRREAIALAIQQASAGDIVLIAGKGHEKVQITREGTASFDDVEVAREALQAAGFGATTRVATRKSGGKACS